MFGLEPKELLLYVGVGLGGLAVLAVLLKLLTGGEKKHKDLQKGQREVLDEYPDPPPQRDSRRLVFDGLEVRLRFVAIAPTGTQHDEIEVDEVPKILEELLRGLGSFVKADKPRVRVWPPQLSVVGFAPTFFRLVESPDRQGATSQWVRVAGPIKIGGKPYLLGLAFYSDEPNQLGMISLKATEWAEHLQIHK